ncbi:MAG: LytR/AlgR family response regulator transcription factor [Bacteroidia bacterium]
MIKAVIIDDEPLARDLILEYLANHKTITVVEQCGDGFEGLKAIMQHKPELIFLDIQMPKINGFEMLELIDNPPGIIFTTAFDEYAIKAFEANAIDYLLKPFSKERFDKAIEKWMNNGNKTAPNDERILKNLDINPEEKNRVVVKTNKGIKIIPIAEITYFEAYDDYVKIYTAEGYFLKKKTMSHYETLLEESAFVRVHRSFLIALNQITRIENPEKETHVALLKNGVKIPLSRQGYGKLKETLGV